MKSFTALQSARKTSKQNAKVRIYWIPYSKEGVRKVVFCHQGMWSFSFSILVRAVGQFSTRRNTIMIGYAYHFSKFQSILANYWRKKQTLNFKKSKFVQLVRVHEWNWYLTARKYPASQDMTTEVYKTPRNKQRQQSDARRPLHWTNLRTAILLSGVSWSAVIR